MTKVSVVIVAHNEATKLDRCLSSINGFSDDVVVIDLASTDNSSQIAQKHEAKLVSHEYVQLVEEIRQESFQYAKHDYILLLDPDEELTPQLIKALSDLSIEKYAAIYIPRKNIVFGKWIQNSRWWPDHQVKLINKNHVKWPKTIHAKPINSGTEYRLAGSETNALIHHNYTDLTDFLSKNLRYASAEAGDLLNSGTKLSLQTTMKKSVSEFVSRYFFAHGYRDGMHGFTLAFLQLIYYYLVYFYYWEGKKYQTIESETELLQHPKELFRHAYKEVIYWTQQVGKRNIKDKLIRKFI